jgi:hypothetical protein
MFEEVFELNTLAQQFSFKVTPPLEADAWREQATNISRIKTYAEACIQEQRVLPEAEACIQEQRVLPEADAGLAAYLLVHAAWQSVIKFPEMASTHAKTLIALADNLAPKSDLALQGYIHYVESILHEKNHEVMRASVSALAAVASFEAEASPNPFLVAYSYIRQAEVHVMEASYDEASHALQVAQCVLNDKKAGMCFRTMFEATALLIQVEGMPEKKIEQLKQQIQAHEMPRASMKLT